MTEPSDHSDTPAPSETVAGAESPPVAEEMSPAERAEARRYGRISLACTLADIAIDVLFLAFAAFVLARPLDSWLAGYGLLSGPRSFLRLFALFGVVYVLHLLVSVPLSFYSGYVVEHRFGLSKQSVRRWIRNLLLSNALAVLFGVVMYGGLFALMWYTGRYWWLIAAGAFFVISVILGQLAPVVLMPLFHKIERLDDPALNERMQRLAEGTGLTIEGVYRLGMSADTTKANAMLAGLGRTRRVLMGDTLLEKFSPDEIEVIFAHEIGHHVHRHIPKMIATGLVISLVGFWLCDQLIVWWAGVPIISDAPTSSLPFVMFLLTVFQLLLGPLQNAISRHYERQCDRYALEHTGMRDAYRAAFAKLARLNKADMEPNPVEVFLLHSHPPIKERLAMAEQ